MKIANRITFWVLLASAVVLIPMSYFSYRASSAAILKQFALIRSLVTQNVELNIVRQHVEIETIVRTIIYEILEERARSPEEFERLFTRCLQKNEGIYGIIFALESTEAIDAAPAWYLHRNLESPDGAPVWIDMETQGAQPRYVERDWYAVPRDTRRPFWSGSYRGRTTGEPMVTFSMPIIDDAGRFLGVFACDVSLDWIDTFVADIPMPNTEIDQVFLLSHSGTVLADRLWNLQHDNIFEIAERRNLPSLAAIARDMIAGKSGDVFYRTPDGDDGHIVFMPIDNKDGDPDTYWSLGIFVPAKLIRQHSFQNGGIQLLIGLGGMILLFAAVRFVARGISEPIGDLQHAALEIASGNLEATVPTIDGGDEIAVLAKAFGTMQHDLKKQIAELAETTRAKERLESELRIGRAIQMSLLPTVLPETPLRGCFDLAASMEPAKQVGGDFYDFFLLDEETLCLVVADVSGKGVPAALLMSRNSALFRSILFSEQHLGRTLEMLNRILCRNNDAMMFITLFAIVIHLPTGACRATNAGHNPPFAVTERGTPAMLGYAESPPLGIDESATYAETTWQLSAREMLFLYTDGVTEAFNGESHLFGGARTAETLAVQNGKPCADTIRAVHDAILQFTQGTPQSDDITLLAFRWISPNH